MIIIHDTNDSHPSQRTDLLVSPSERINWDRLWGLCPFLRNADDNYILLCNITLHKTQFMMNVSVSSAAGSRGDAPAWRRLDRVSL